MAEIREMDGGTDDRAAEDRVAEDLLARERAGQGLGT